MAEYIYIYIYIYIHMICYMIYDIVHHGPQKDPKDNRPHDLKRKTSKVPWTIDIYIYMHKHIYIWHMLYGSICPESASLLHHQLQQWRSFGPRKSSSVAKRSGESHDSQAKMTSQMKATTSMWLTQTTTTRAGVPQGCPFPAPGFTVEVDSATGML